MEDRPKVLELVDEMLHPTRDVWDSTFRIVRPDGTMSWIQSVGRVERDAAGKVTRLAGLELDVTARRQAEEALQAWRDEEHNRELRLLLETAAQGILSVDAQGTILMANRALETMFGWQPGELTGQSIERLVPQSFRQLHAGHRTRYFAAPHPGPMASDRDLVGERKDGSIFPIEVSLNHVATPGGGHAIAFVTDITERRHAAAALRERTVELERRSAQLSRLASDLTLAEQHAREQLAKTLHDGLQQMLVLAAMDLDQQINRDSRRAPPPLMVQAKRQIDEAITAARSLSVELSPPLMQGAGLPTALNWLAEWSQRKYQLKVHVSADPLANSPRKDVCTLLFESVRELLFNAVKHAQVNRVTVDLAREPDDMLSITVTDRGVGFDAAGLADRAKAGQAGWGLFSIRERLTLLGGQFEIESAPGRGTRFRLIAPAGTARGSVGEASCVSHAAMGQPPGHAVAERTLKILIVDDHVPMREALRRLLQARPEFQVVGEAANGLEAIGQAHALRPDAVLMDVSMPEMDGVEATRHICAELPFVHILGLSMYPRTEEHHPIEQAGAERFFTKGVDTQLMIDHLLVMHRAITSGHPVSR
jgi:PAS domain S-box-containing protein